MDNTQVKFSVFQREMPQIPIFEEKQMSGKEWLNYGSNNLYPQYLWDLYLKSALSQAIINAQSDYIAGAGVEPSEAIGVLAEDINEDGDTLNEIIKKITIDYCIFGGFALQVIKNHLGEVSEIYWLDFRNVRVDKEGTKAYYSEDWERGKDYVAYDIYNRNNRVGGSYVVYFKGHKTRGTYPICQYCAAIPAIETSAEIAKYHLNAIHNNFNGNFIINFNNGVPTEDVQKEIEEKVKKKFCGSENAGKFMLSFNQSKDNGVDVQRIDDDNSDKKFETLREDTRKEIYSAFRITPALVGVNPENNGFSKTEFDESFTLYNETVIKPMQRDIVRIFNKIFNTDNAFYFNPFQIGEDKNNTITTDNLD